MPCCVSIPQWCDCCTAQGRSRSIALPVSIPQWCDCCEPLFVEVGKVFLSFNPTMVRLLLDEVLKYFNYNVMFQSHNGAIAATPCHSPQEIVETVSIPQWCDCCPFTDFVVGDITGFNPTMVRLLPATCCTRP